MAEVIALFEIAALVYFMFMRQISVIDSAIAHNVAKVERKAEWLGNDNRKTMIKVKTTGQMLPSKSGTALPSPSQAPGYTR